MLCSGGSSHPEEIDLNAARLARHLAGNGVDPDLARSLAEHLSDEIEQSVATKDHVETVVTREVQGLRVEITQQIQSLRVELSDKLTMHVAGCSAGSRW
jgi:2-phosphoglycerate kinase